MASSISGVIATLAHDACSTPIDTIKQRLQLNSRPYKGVFDCVAQTVKKDGIGALYKGNVNIHKALFGPVAELLTLLLLLQATQQQ